jgi:glycolate oxidase iron-sulfur subunit
MVNDPFEQHIGLCLNCRNCETVCPSGVRYSVLLEAARGEIVKQGNLSGREKFLRWAAFKQLFPYPWRLNLLVGAMGLYQRTLQPLVRGSGLLKRFGRLGEMEGMLPERRALRTYQPARTLPLPTGAGKQKVALFTGCIMRSGFANIHEATVRVLERNGYEVRVPEEQICCAALHVHAGERDTAKAMAKRNIDLFRQEPWDAIVINAAGCGAQLKDYPELFRDDPEYFHHAEEFSKRVKDVSELLANSPLVQGDGGAQAKPALKTRTRVTYQDACHLAHGQKVRLQPRQVLKQIGNLDLVEMRASDRCCGSAGIYNVIHTEISDQLIDEKMSNTRDTQAEVVVTGNIGCLLQLEYGKKRAGWNGRVLHLVELLDEAYGGG